MMAGFGGQGILLIGNLLAEAALLEGYEVTYLPSYGVEMRGGTANCTVVISDEEIGSPQVSAPQVMLVMSEQARERFEPRVKPGGLLIVNQSLCDITKISRKDLEILCLPFNKIADEIENSRFANMVALGVYLGKKPVVKLTSVEQTLKENLTGKKAQFIPSNLKAIEKGIELAKKTGG
jgi:2-oxoglutarate ferredoxin oxidoreductase subunit gamma